MLFLYVSELMANLAYLKMSPVAPFSCLLQSLVVVFSISSKHKHSKIESASLSKQFLGVSSSVTLTKIKKVTELIFTYRYRL